MPQTKKKPTKSFSPYGLPEGEENRRYMRSLSFVFTQVFKKLYPQISVEIQHSISGGLYCRVLGSQAGFVLDTRSRDRIKAAMEEVIQEDLPIERAEIPYQEALTFFTKKGRSEKVELLKQHPSEWVEVYRLDTGMDSFYGDMVPSTGHLQTFDLEIFDRGLVLLGPDPRDHRRVNNFQPTYLLSDTYNEAERWSSLQGISYVSDLNHYIQSGQIGEVIRMTESLQDYKIMKLAQEILGQNKRLILIAAPSSSGKTSFSYKLTTSLRVLGLRPLAVHFDDYFVNRGKTPMDAQGEPDFEALEAVDLPLFEADILALLQGKRIERIRFDFLQGKRVYTGECMETSRENPIIVEGIHALNPRIFPSLPDKMKFLIALSVITQINLDQHNRISTTDLRLLRRIARDMQFRGYSAKETIASWAKVRRGEEKNIFPYSEQADAMFNSSSVYEIAALKPLVEGPLQAIGPEEEEYREARRLLDLLAYFYPLEDQSDIVNTSILREFLGGSKILS